MKIEVDTQIMLNEVRIAVRIFFALLLVWSLLLVAFSAEIILTSPLFSLQQTSEPI